MKFHVNGNGNLGIPLSGCGNDDLKRGMDDDRKKLEPYISTLERYLIDPQDEVKWAVADGLTFFYAIQKDWAAVKKLLSHPDKDVRQEAVGTLRAKHQLTIRKVWSQLKTLLEDECEDVRLVAARTLCEKGKTQAEVFLPLPILVDRLTNPEDEHRVYAARAISGGLYSLLGPSYESTVSKKVDWEPFEQALPALRRALKDKNGKVRAVIAEALCWYYLRVDQPEEIVRILKNAGAGLTKTLRKGLDSDKFPKPDLLLGYVRNDDRGKLATRFRRAAGKNAKKLDIASDGLDSVGMRELPPELGLLTKVESLDISSNRFTFLPPEVGQLHNLKSLAATQNLLFTLPPEFGELKKLQTLYLYRNQLETLPHEFCQLENLYYLQLSENRLTALPSEFGKLTNLRFLELQRNRLRSLPKTFGELEQLESCSLEGNALKELPMGFSKLKNLRSLELSYNDLCEIPAQVFDLENLEALTFKHNQLTSLPPEIGRLSRLKNLTLRGNQLTELPPEIATLSDLEYLDLASNQLRSLPPGLDQLKKLRWLDLHANELGLPDTTFHIWNRPDVLLKTVYAN